MEAGGDRVVGCVECTDLDRGSADGRKSVVAISTQFRGVYVHVTRCA